MVLPMSMTPSGPESFSEPSTSTENDSTKSFKLFLDLITPVELSNLLRARVRHLLKTWPPQSASAMGATSSSTTLSEPSFESVRAFATFFRTQDSPGPSPIDLSATPSLQALHHHLIALQTLLSFLSGRELQDIVRARLAESGKGRSVAVQGLMDIMRSAGGEEVEENSVDMDLERGIVEDKIIGSDDGAVGRVDEPAVAHGQARPSNISVGKRKAFANDHEGPESEAHNEERILTKRKRGEGNENNRETEDSVGLQPDSRPPLPAFVDLTGEIPPPPSSDAPASTSSVLSPGCRVINSSFNSVYSGTDPAPEPQRSPLDMTQKSPTSEPRLPIGSRFKRESRSEASMIDNLTPVGAESSFREAGTSTNVLQNSDEEDEGLVVTLIEEDMARGLSRLQPPVPSVATASSSPAVDAEARIPDTVSITPAAASIPIMSLKAGEVQSPLAASSAQETETSPGPGVSRAEWNRKRFRAALGLPPRDPENDAVDFRDTKSGNSLAQDASAEQLQNIEEFPLSGIIPMADESVNSASTTTNPPDSLPRDSSFNLACTHQSVSFPYRDAHASRSQSPSLHDSDLDDRASPPGPILRAVDWASRVAPLALPLESVDEADEQEGSEDTLALGSGAVFDLGIKTEGAVKPATSMFGKGFVSHNTQMLPWQDEDGNGNEPIWNDGDEKSFDMGGDVDKDDQTIRGTRSRGKLFIRLPARRGGGGDNGRGSTGTDPSASASASASPPPPSPPYHISQSSEKDGILYGRGTEAGATLLTGSLDARSGTLNEKDSEENLKSHQVHVQTSLHPGASSTIPAAEAPSSSGTNASSRPQSQTQSQAASTCQTPSSSSGVPQHGQRPHGQAYPPPHAHAYPGPWFGAMLYLPFGGPSHLRTHPLARPPSSTHHNQLHASSQASQQLQQEPQQQQRGRSKMPSRADMQSGSSSPTSPTPGGSKEWSKESPDAPLQVSPEESAPGRNVKSGPGSRSRSGSGLASASASAAPPRSGAVSPPVPPPEGPKRHFKRKLPGDQGEASASNGDGEESDLRYTDDVGVKESALLKRRCFNCRAVQAPSWRKSKLNSGKILCNKCGIYESTHMTARPLKTRPRRSNESGINKKRKTTKKTAQASLS